MLHRSTLGWLSLAVLASTSACTRGAEKSKDEERRLSAQLSEACPPEKAGVLDADYAIRINARLGTTSVQLLPSGAVEYERTTPGSREVCSGQPPAELLCRFAAAVKLPKAAAALTGTVERLGVDPAGTDGPSTSVCRSGHCVLIGDGGSDEVPVELKLLRAEAQQLLHRMMGVLACEPAHQRLNPY